jgi:hypothetical protein
MTDKLTDDKKKLADEQAAREKATEAHDKVYKGTPTPTQEELNLINLGNHPELAADGSTDPLVVPKEKTKQMESGSGGSYQTRQATPKSETKHG